jgi:uncharacterized protein YecT (DUF1311 family)
MSELLRKLHNLLSRTTQAWTSFRNRNGDISGFSPENATPKSSDSVYLQQINIDEIFQRLKFIEQDFLHLEKDYQHLAIGVS